MARIDAMHKPLETMVGEDVNQLPVVQNSHVEGIVSRGHIRRLLQTRAELDLNGSKKVKRNLNRWTRYSEPYKFRQTRSDSSSDFTLRRWLK